LHLFDDLCDCAEGEERVVKEQENLVRRVGWSEVDEELVEEVDSYCLFSFVIWKYSL